MTRQVSYYYFGRQCPGFYMGEQARRAAELLDYDYIETDISHRPDVAASHNLFCAGTIVIGDFQLHFPGRPEQIVEAYRRRGPLPGSHDYRALPPAELTATLPLTPETAGQAFRLCIPTLADELVCRKQEWLRGQPGLSDFAGIIGLAGEDAVAYAEVLPETLIPYPLPDKSPHNAFITCIYCPTEWGLSADYRESLIRHLVPELRSRGYRHLRAISGRALPYPNGPEELFLRCGFREVKLMGPVLLRHSWDEACLMQLDLDSVN